MEQAHQNQQGVRQGPNPFGPEGKIEQTVNYMQDM